MPRRLRFNAFTMNCVSHIHHGQWRRPDTRQLEYTDLNTWVDLAKILERGKFDAIFLADVIGTYNVYGGDRTAAVEEGLQTPVNDPSLLIPALAYATKDIGSYDEFIVHVLPVLRARGLAADGYAEGTLRRKLFGADRLSERHPAARYRGAFAGEPVGAA